MTKGELIKWLQDLDVADDTLVYLGDDNNGIYTETEEVIVTKAGYSLNDRRTIIAIY